MIPATKQPRRPPQGGHAYVDPGSRPLFHKWFRTLSCQDVSIRRIQDQNPWRADGNAPGHLLPLPDNGPHRFAAAPVVGDGFFYALIRKPSP